MLIGFSNYFSVDLSYLTETLPTLTVALLLAKLSSFFDEDYPQALPLALCSLLGAIEIN